MRTKATIITTVATNLVLANMFFNCLTGPIRNIVLEIKYHIITGSGKYRKIEPAKSCEVPQSVEDGKDFQTTERIESENEGAQDGAEDTETKTNTETFDPSVPRQTGCVQSLNESRNQTFVR